MSLVASRVQSRKALRTLRVLVGDRPGPAPGAEAQAIPEGYAGDDHYRRKAARRLRPASEILN